MIKNFSDILSKKFLVLLFFLLLFSFSIYIPLPWNEPIDDAIISLQHKIRGSRTIEDDLVVIYIGDEDLKSLGGWPITRDYYSYLIHILKSAGAKVVAIDVLLAKADPRHPEYDKTLSTFIESSGNVCLPMIFSELTFPDKNEPGSDNPAYYGDNPTFPLKEFLNHTAALGFSNFSKSNNVLKVPIVATNKDSIFYSFGAQLARTFSSTPLPDQTTILQLNHFGDLDNVQSLGFVELLKKYQTTPDSVNFTGKLLLLTVSTPGISAIKSTPLSAALPASLIHLTVAENLIYQNYLTRISAPLQIAILTLLLIAAYFVANLKSDKIYLFFSAGLLALFWGSSIFAFSFYNLIIPPFYPSLAFLSVFIYLLADRYYQNRNLQSSMSDLMQEQIAIKEKQLQDARDNLDKQATTSEELTQLAEQRKHEIINLEKDISDLKIYSGNEQIKPENKAGFKDIIFSEHSPMAQVLELVLKVSPNDIPVLISGETGTGKEMIARAIHTSSTRNSQPFVAINCGALSETLLESELFGHEKGSFTGAATMRRGRFEMANGGSIFLDEISETSAAFQAKLLRVLQESTFERLGAERTLKTNVRIIAATNKNLQVEMESNLFRADLFYRLNGFPINLPALRERKNDLPLLVHHFLVKYNVEMEISDQAI